MTNYFILSSLVVAAFFLICVVLARSGVIRRKKSNREEYGRDLAEYDLKSISLLNQNYHFDLEHNAVEIPFVLDQVEDIADTSLSEKGRLRISSSFLCDLMDNFSYIPRQFRIRLLFSFKSHDGYSWETIMNAVQSRIEEYYNRALHSDKVEYFKVLVYTILCIIISLLSTVPITVNYASGIDSIYTLVIGILLENAALLLLWQAGGTILDILDQVGPDKVALYRRLDSISLIDEQGQRITREREEIIRHWPFVKLRERIAHALLLLANAYVFVIFVVEAISYATAQIELSSSTLILFSAEWCLTVIITCFNIAFYFDKRPIARYSFQVSLIVILLLAVYNISRLLYIFTNGIPFDYDDFLFTYLLLAIINSICISVIQKERETRTASLLRTLPQSPSL